MRDDFDFHLCPFWQCRYLDRGAGREIRSEIFSIDFIHSRKICQIGQEDCAFQHVRKGELLIFKNRPDVLEHPLSLRFDIAAHQIACGRIQSNLAGAEEQIVETHTVIVGSKSRR